MVKFTFFDVGGVIVNDFSNGNKLEEVRDLFKLGKVWFLIIELISKKFPLYYDHWISHFVKKFKKNKSIWFLVKEIKKTSKVGLLTNMHPKMFEKLKENNLMPNFKWSTLVDSSIVKVRKPDIKIFQIAEKMAGFKGKEILFIDNGKRNVEVAKEFGWNTFLYDPNNPLDSNKKLLKYFNDN